MNNFCLTEREAFYQFSTTLFIILFSYFMIAVNFNVLQSETKELKSLYTDINKSVYEIKKEVLKNE